jgi:hypothetical protein
LLTYFAEEERRKSIVDEHGEARYHHMIHDLSHPRKIRLTFETIVPAFSTMRWRCCRRCTPDPANSPLLSSGLEQGRFQPPPMGQNRDFQKAGFWRNSISAVYLQIFRVAGSGPSRGATTPSPDCP